MTSRWPGPALRSLPWGHGLLAWLVAGFFLIRLGETLGSAPGWIRNYGDDFLCLPLVLSLALVVYRLDCRAFGATLPVSHGLFACGVFAVFFEVILPRISTAAVADPLDVLVYLAGFLVFQLGLNRDVAEKSDHADLPLTEFSPLVPGLPNQLNPEEIWIPLPP